MRCSQPEVNVFQFKINYYYYCIFFSLQFISVSVSVWGEKTKYAVEQSGMSRLTHLFFRQKKKMRTIPLDESKGVDFVAGLNEAPLGCFFFFF